jgi:LDH2 family malate/lactate/ureidoglycolate dehydrogenase
MPKLRAQELEALTSAIFKAAGSPDDVAERLGLALVGSNLMGVDSHGVVQIPLYVEWVRQGQVEPGANVEVVRETPNIAILDGHWGFGQVTAQKGMQLAIEKAKRNQISLVGLINCNHIGRLGEYTMMAMAEGLIGIVVANAGPEEVAPFGGAERVFDTNPISVAVPAAKAHPFLLDYATSACAEGKLRVARNKGARIPEGWILDKDGKPSTDPNDFYEGGVILPFGGHKGYALALLVDLLGGALTCAGCTSLPEYGGGNGVLMGAIDVEAFRPLDEFIENADRLFTRVRQSKPMPGVSEILIPGEPEFRERKIRERDGIPIDDTTWTKILGVAGELQVDVDTVLNPAA